MLSKRAFVVVGLMGGSLLCAAGCLLPAIEGAKAAHVALEGKYTEIIPAAKGTLSTYKGYKVGACSSKTVALPADTKESDKPKAQEQIDAEVKYAQEVAVMLPERFSEYLVDDAKLQPGATPTLVVTVKDVRVTQRHGIIGVALPQVDVESTVTFTDAQTGKVLGVASVYGHTSSRVLGNARQLANFIGRGTAKWINENRAPAE